MTSAETIKYSVFIPKGQHKLLKQAALDTDVSMQVLVRRAVDHVVGELQGGSISTPAPQYTPDEQKWIDELLFIMRSDPRTANDIQRVLWRFAHEIRLSSKAHNPGGTKVG